MIAQRSNQAELLDSTEGSVLSQAELAQNLADIARLNRLTGATRLLCHAALNLIPAEIDSCMALDLGTGAADWPLAFTTFAARQRPQLSVKVIAVDLHPLILRYAKQKSESSLIVGADGTGLPLPKQSVDLVVCAQTFHHLAPDRAVELLREMARVSRLGFVLFDLSRSHLAVLALQGLTRLISKNRLTRHDGPLSVRRAYRIGEVWKLAAAAGLDSTRFQIKPIHPFRWLACYRHNAPQEYNNRVESG